MAFVYWVLSSASLTAGRLLNAALGTVAVVLTAVLAAQLFRRRRLSFLAGGMAALFPPMVLSSATLMSEPLFVSLSLGSVCSAIRYAREHKPGWLLGSGLLWSLATLTRPNGAVMVIPLLFIGLRGAANFRRSILHVGLAALFAAAPLAVWEARDIDVMHQAVLIATQDGYLLAGTYNATSANDRLEPAIWIPATDDPAMAKIYYGHPGVGEAQMSALFLHASLRYIGNHPLYPMKVVLYNTLRLFDVSHFSFSRQVMAGEYGFGSTAAALEQLASLLVEGMAIVGLIAGALRASFSKSAWSVPALLVVVTVPVQSFNRFRAPLTLGCSSSAPLRSSRSFNSGTVNQTEVRSDQQKWALLTLV